MIRRSFIASLLGAAASPLVKWLPKLEVVELSPIPLWYVSRDSVAVVNSSGAYFLGIEPGAYVPHPDPQFAALGAVVPQSITPEADA